jgi:putative DNA primase/helicase
LADEVVARSEQYHVKNVLKGLITGERLRINPKNMKSFEEKNHVNLVFLSNERVPVIIEMDDRRHQVLWTPEKLGADFYYEVSDEIANGGIEALHYHLKTLDLGDFSEHTKPIMTAAKSNLIDLCKSTTVRFYEAWQVGDIAGIKPMPALSDDVYALYSAWCRTEGVRTAPKNKAIDELVSIPGVKKERKRYWINGLSTPNPRMIIYPKHSPELSPGQSEPAWLGEMVSDFKQGVNEFIKGEL